MEDVNNVVNIATEDAFGEIYECHDFGSSTTMLLSNDSTWHGWGTCSTGDMHFVSSSLSGGIMCLNIEREGYYAIRFNCTVEGTAAGFTVDAGLFKNGSLQNDLRGRIDFGRANTQSQIEFSGILQLTPGDYVDVRFMGNKDKEIHLKLGSLSVYKID
jgi:hypothetical protein